MSISVPEITEGVAGYSFVWTEGITVDVSRVREHLSDGSVKGEIAVRCGQNGASQLLHRAQMNFLSTQARDKITKTLTERNKNLDWYGAMEQLCHYVVDLTRRGEPVVELLGTADTPKPEYLIYPLVIKNYPNIIFGDPGSFKSAISLYCATVLQMEWHENPLGLPAPDRPIICLDLDWETDKETAEWTLSRMVRGHGLKLMPLYYRRCHAPLAQDIEAIRNFIDETKAEVLIMDSLAAACGGEDLNKSGPAMAFYQALRSLNVTAIVLAHNSKDRETKMRSIIGHQMFTAQARNIWECKKVQEPDDETIDIALFHRKAPPFSKISPAIGAHVEFTEDSMTITPQSATSMREFISEMGMKAQIRDALTDGAATTKDIAVSLMASEASVRTTLNRMKAQGGVIQLPDKRWGLPL